MTNEEIHRYLDLDGHDDSVGGCSFSLSESDSSGDDDEQTFENVFVSDAVPSTSQEPDRVCRGRGRGSRRMGSGVLGRGAGDTDKTIGSINF